MVRIACAEPIDNSSHYLFRQGFALYWICPLLSAAHDPHYTHTIPLQLCRIIGCWIITATQPLEFLHYRHHGGSYLIVSDLAVILAVIG